jgi:hypothetical protein
MDGHVLVPAAVWDGRAQAAAATERNPSERAPSPAGTAPPVAA